MNQQELQQAILDHVNRPGYRPVKPRVIAKKLGVSKGEAVDVKRAVKRLVRDGKIRYGSAHLVKPVGAEKSGSGRSAAKPTGTGQIVGVFRRTASGYGFVRPSGTAPAASRGSDIYIPASKAADASTGDVVAVRILKGGPKPTGDRGPRGEIVDVIQRHTNQFVGTYFESGGVGLVEVDGGVFSHAVPVGDPGAKGARADDKVVIEMVRFPAHYRDGDGVIVEVLGQRGQPGVDTLSIIREFGLADEMPEDALEEARKQGEAFDGAIHPGRKDMTDRIIVTIDPADARDFDDAISLERLDQGRWRLGVHIADVAHFVQPKTPLDREAYQRATSVYLPDRVLPMLPEIISNSLASLQPGKVRYVKSVFIEYTAEGIRTHVEVHRAAIKSDWRFNYEEIDDYLADRQPWVERLPTEVHSLVGRMHELGMILRRRRFQRGSLELAMPEIKVDLDDQGAVSGAHLAQNTESHQIIEEFMLAANEAVAEFLFDRKIPFLRRIHPSPSPAKLKALTEFVHELGFEADDLESRFAMQELLREAVERPEKRAVHLAVLRSFQRAVYSPVEEGHYALASECYCHFTSPIRRYPDLTIHRLIDDVLDGRTPTADGDALMRLGEHCSDREERAEAAERELIRLKLLLYLKDRIGEEMDAVVTGVESFGLFVQGIDLPAEGLIHISTLQDDYYQFDRSTHTLQGRRESNLFRLGDPVRVAVARVDLDRRDLDFHLIRPEAEATSPKKTPPPRRKVRRKPAEKSKKRRK